MEIDESATAGFFFTTGRGLGLPLGAVGADAEVEIELPPEVLAD